MSGPDAGEDPSAALLIDRFADESVAGLLADAQARADEFRLSREQSAAEVALLERMLRLALRERANAERQARLERNELSADEIRAHVREIAEAQRLRAELSGKS